MNGRSVSNIQSRAIPTMLWLVRLGIAIILLLAGSAKLWGVEEMVQLFRAIGVGEWLRYATGGLEVLAAILMMIPATSSVGLLLAAAALAGGFARHIFVLGSVPSLPATIVGVFLVLLYAGRRRNDPTANTRFHPTVQAVDRTKDSGVKP